jgi:hypothetical protein
MDEAAVQEPWLPLTCTDPVVRISGSVLQAVEA